MSGVYRVGQTGPSDYTGGYGSQGDYHIDIKFSHALPLEQRVELYTQLARQAQGEGRRFQFSNRGANNAFFDPSAPYEERARLYQLAAGAHAPSRGGFDSLDYYSIGSQDRDRWGKSAEGAPIYAPVVKGGRVQTSQGGGYGGFADVYGPKGQRLVSIGHADTRFLPEKGEVMAMVPEQEETLVEPQPPDQYEGSFPQPEKDELPPVPKKLPKVDGTIDNRDYFKDLMKREMLAQLMTPAQPKKDTGAADRAYADINRDMDQRGQRMAMESFDTAPIAVNFKPGLGNFSKDFSKVLQSAAKAGIKA